jgi:DNA-binding LacI/PurR family transcriptional regulator
MPVRLDVDAVVATDAAGAASAVRHLAPAGPHPIAFLGDRAAGAARLAGYRPGSRRPVWPPTRRSSCPTSSTPRSPSRP